jgi:hypothetical protein
MKSLLLSIAALLACGFWVPGPNYDKQRAEEIDWLLEQVGGQKKLRELVTDIVEEHPSVDGVDLSKSKLEETWEYFGRHQQWLLISGDWLLEHNGRDLEFSFWWFYKDEKAIIAVFSIQEDGSLKRISLTNETDLVTLT